MIYSSLALPDTGAFIIRSKIVVLCGKHRDSVYCMQTFKKPLQKSSRCVLLHVKKAYEVSQISNPFNICRNFGIPLIVKFSRILKNILTGFCDFL
jgi:hypothetical protein